MFNFKRGILQIEVLSANLMRDTETFGKMDPFATFTWDVQNKKEEKYKTKVCQDQGKNPVWKNEKFQIVISDTLPNIEGEISVRLWDENVTDSDPIGFAVLKFGQLCFNGGREKSYSIFWKGEIAGSIRLKTNFEDLDRNQNIQKFIELEKEAQMNSIKIEQSSNMPLCMKQHTENYIQVESSGFNNLPNNNVYTILNSKKNSYFSCIWDKQNNVVIDFKFKRPVSLSGYGIQSAPNYPDRDPRKWTIIFMTSKSISQNIPLTNLNKDGNFELNEFCDAFADRNSFKHFKLPFRMITDSVKVIFKKDWDGYNPQLASKDGYQNQEMFQINDFQFYA